VGSDPGLARSCRTRPLEGNGGKRDRNPANAPQTTAYSEIQTCINSIPGINADADASALISRQQKVKPILASENKPTPSPYLSIVVPAYNEEARLPTSLQEIAGFVASKPFPVEVIVVDNNSTDRTGAIIEEFAAKYDFVRGIFEGIQGKDADLSMPIEEVDKFLPPQIEAFDIAIASREIAGAVRYNEPWYRHLMGRVFNTIVRVFAVPGLQDTQCGFKMFRSDVAEALLHRRSSDPLVL